MESKATEAITASQEAPGEDGLRGRLADVLFDGALTLAYSVGHDIGELADIVAGLAGRGIMLIPAVGNAVVFATAVAAGDPNTTDQYGTVRVCRRFGEPDVCIDRGELTTEEYIEALAAAVRDEKTDLGVCSKDGCDRPAIEGKPGYIGPLYCSPVHAFADRSLRAGA